MSYNTPTSPTELYDLGDIRHLHQRRPAFETYSTQESLGGNAPSQVSFEVVDHQDRPPASLSTDHDHLLRPKPDFTARRPNMSTGNVTPSRPTWVFVSYCLLHAVPLVVTIAILCLNALKVYWQDLGSPNQNAVLQALQYAAKAQEIMMATSLTAIVVHRTQHDLFTSQGVPLGLITACYQLGDPLSCCKKEFFGGLKARLRSTDWSHSFPLPFLLIFGFALTSILGPSSAVAIIPRLDWWDVPKAKAFGTEYTDRVYFNRTQDELWPANITNAIYANLSDCTQLDDLVQDCAVIARDSVAPWISRHQSFGTKPNITIFENSEVTRYLTSQGGPPDNSSWTVSSTVGSVFARDLNNYWDWLVENSSLPMNIQRPLIRPAFLDPNFKFRKPLVQAQCHSYFEPDWEDGIFEFPHNELLAKPLDEFKESVWRLPNEFVLNLLGDDRSIGNDPNYPPILFDWFDTASNFSDTGAPSLGALIIYITQNGSQALATCAFDSRWVPVGYYLDPKDTVTIRQNSPNPMDLLNGSSKEAAADLTKMRISLDWANTMNVRDTSSNVPSTTVVEEMLQEWSGGGNFIFPEPEPVLSSGFHFKSLDWRLSTTLGLYLTEGLARAFSDVTKGSMLYRQSSKPGKSYVRYLNDINQPVLKEGYRHGKLDWVEERDPRWNHSILPWNEWAPENGYTEIVFTIQRNGYGYGFDGLPIKLATAALVIYILLVTTHLVHLMVKAHLYDDYSKLGHLLILAWNSAPAMELSDAPELEKSKAWSQVSRIGKEQHGPQLVLDRTNVSP